MNHSYEFKAMIHGSLHGVPCWIDMRDDIAPGIQAKGGFIGEVALDVMEFLFGFYCALRCSVDPDFEPMFAFKLGEEVN
tara:strand:- start:19074 stop:19310 length:237 start_codon:yes stop_codon:yes gene_type:complete